MILLLQSCVAYQKTPVSIDKAMQQQDPIKVVTKEGSVVHLKEIIDDNGQYYGITVKDEVRVPLNSLEVKYYLKDYKKSNTQTFFLIAGIVVPLGVLGILAMVGFWNEITGGLDSI